MSGVNKVILIGNVGKDPDVKYLDGGVAVARFSLATTESYKNKEGKRVDQTEWHNLTVWRGSAELAEKYVRKGMMLYVEGKIRTRQYGEENNKKWYTEIVVDNFTMLGGPRTESNAPAAQQPVQEDVPVSEVPSDDLPF